MIARLVAVGCLALGLLVSTTGHAAPGRKDKEARRDPTPPVQTAPSAEPPEPKRPPGDTRRIVGVLDIRVDGVPAEISAQFQQKLEAQVDTKHFWLARRTRVRELMTNSTKWTEGCVIGQCLGEVRAQTGADLVLLAALTGAGTSFGFVVTLVRTDTGSVLAQKSQRCDVCTINQALAEATAATVAILNAMPDKLPDVAAEPPAAAARIVAETDVATQAARRSDTKLATAHHHRRVVGASLTVAGLVAAAAGATLYAIEHHASYGLATAAAGGGLALGGVLVLAF